MVAEDLYFDGEKYLSVRSASKITKYAADYIGQLCRAGKLRARRVGRGWYIEEKSLAEHLAAYSAFSKNHGFRNQGNAPVAPEIASDVARELMRREIDARVSEEIKSLSKPVIESVPSPVLPELKKKPEEKKEPLVTRSATPGGFSLAERKESNKEKSNEVIKKSERGFKRNEENSLHSLIPSFLPSPNKIAALTLSVGIVFFGYQLEVNQVHLADVARLPVPVVTEISKNMRSAEMRALSLASAGDGIVEIIRRAGEKIADRLFGDFGYTLVVTAPDEEKNQALLSEIEGLKKRLASFERAGGTLASGGSAPAVIERVVSVVSGVSLSDLNVLENSLKSELYRVAAVSASANNATYQAVALTNRIDALFNTAISGATITGSTFAGSVAATSLSASGDGSVGGALTVTGTITSSSGTTTVQRLSIAGLDCSALTNAGKLTVDATGGVVCQDDLGGGASASDFTYSSVEPDLSFGLVRMATTSNQLVLGGTSTSTAARLEVTGGIFVTGSTSTIANLSIDNSTTTNATTTNLAVTGTASTSALTISNNASIGGTLNVAGAAVFSSTFSAGTTTLTNLAVTNTSTSTFAGPVASAAGNLILASAGTTNNLLLNPYGGNVGIGTTSPYAKLSVAGEIVGAYFTATSTSAASTFPYASTTALTISGTASTSALVVSNNASVGGTLNVAGQIFASNGSSGAPSYSFTTDTNTGIYRIAEDNLIIQTGGIARLDVRNSLILTNVPLAFAGTAAAPAITNSSDLTSGLFGNAADMLGIAVSGAEKARFTTTGLGIGTTNPGSKLEVVGDIISKGTSWTSRVSAADNSWFSVTYGNGLFVAVAITGTGNRVMTSPDGITWTARTSAADNQWQYVTYGNGLFVAVAFSGTGDRVMTSSDGITWTARTSAVDNAWRSVTYGNGLFVAVASTGTGDRVMTSSDGITWTARTSAADNDWRSVTYGNGLFVAVANTGTGNRVMTSPDGITWTLRTSAADNNWISVTYGNGLFVAVANTGTGNRVMTSPDGITWTARTSAADNDWSSVTYGNGLFVAVASTGTGNRVMTSPDGITWTLRTSAADNSWFSVTYGNGLFVAVAFTGTGNRVMTSGKAETISFSHNNLYQGGMNIFGNVGIGTTSPYANLTVWGSGTGNTKLAEFVNSASTTQFMVTNDGRVGIGTSSPSFTGLTVSGNVVVAGGNDLFLYDSTGVLTTVLEENVGQNATVLAARTNSDKIFFEANGGNRLVIDSTGNIGIGTTTPNNKLDIYSTTKSAIGFSGASGDGYKWTIGMDVTNGGRFSIASSTALGTTDRFVIDSNGNVGIGTTSPYAKLSVVGETVAPLFTATTTGFRGPNGSASAPSYSFSSDTSTGIWGNTDGLHFSKGGTEGGYITGSQFLIRSGTNVSPSLTEGFVEATSGLYWPTGGLGVITGSTENARFTARTLDLYAATAVDTGYTLNARKSRGTAASPSVITTGDDLLKLSGYGYVGGTNTYQEAAQILFDSIGTISDSATGIAGVIRFLTADTGSEPAERLTISNSGNVGINNTSPASYSNSKLVVGVGNSSNISFATSSGSAGGAGGFQIASWYNSVKIGYIDSELTDGTLGSEDSLLKFATIGNGTLATRMTLSEAGNLTLTGNCSDAAGGGGCTADYAEVYRKDTESPMEKGDILAVSTSTGKTVRADVSNSLLLGVFTTAPGSLIGQRGSSIQLGVGKGVMESLDTDEVPVSLSGRVPVKVTNENGPIKVGDRIVLSSLPGVGMRAGTSTTMTVGFALESFDPANPETNTGPYMSTSTPVEVNVNGTTYHKKQITVFVDLKDAVLDADVYAAAQATTTNAWMVDQQGGLTSVNFFGDINLQGNRLLDVSRISGYMGKWSIDEEGRFVGDSIEVRGTVKVGSPERRTGVTLFDEVTGDPYCLSLAAGAVKTVVGECPSAGVSGSVSSGAAPVEETPATTTPETTTDTATSTPPVESTTETATSTPSSSGESAPADGGSTATSTELTSP